MKMCNSKKCVSVGTLAFHTSVGMMPTPWHCPHGSIPSPFPVFTQSNATAVSLHRGLSLISDGGSRTLTAHLAVMK